MPRLRRRLRGDGDSHVAKDAHYSISGRFEQAASGGIGLVDAVLDPAGAGGRRGALEPAYEQLADSAPVHGRVHVALAAPELACVVQGAVGDHTLGVADDKRAPLEL